MMILCLSGRILAPTGQRPLLKDILGARMMIMCEEQLVDTPIAYEDQLKSYIVFFGTKHIVK